MPGVHIEQPSPIDQTQISTASALDRTLLAWIRTGLTLIGFGFTLAKFVHDLLAKGDLRGVSLSYPREVGFALMGLGIATLIGGAVEYVSLRRKVHPNGSIWSTSLIVTICLTILAVIFTSGLLRDLKGV